MTLSPGAPGSYLLAGFAGLVFVAVVSRYANDDRESDRRRADFLAGTGTAALLASFSGIVPALGLPRRSSGTDEFS